MSNSIVIDGKEYKNYRDDEPDRKILFEDLKDNRLYSIIYPQHYKLITLGSSIYYTIDDSKKNFNYGTLLKYLEPNIFIFIDRKLFYIWSIQIDESVDIYVKDPEKVRQENIQKENLWKLYLKGHVSINEEIN